MDSLTHIVLGAAVGTAVLGRKVGPEAALWGAVCGTLPDLDVLLPYGDPVRDFTFHRARQPSLFWLTARLALHGLDHLSDCSAEPGRASATGGCSPGWRSSRIRCSMR